MYCSWRTATKIPARLTTIPLTPNMIDKFGLSVVIDMLEGIVVETEEADWIATVLCSAAIARFMVVSLMILLSVLTRKKALEM